MSPAIAALLQILIPAVIQGIPSAVAMIQQIYTMIQNGTPPTDAQCADMTAQCQADDAIAAAAIAAAGGPAAPASTAPAGGA